MLISLFFGGILCLLVIWLSEVLPGTTAGLLVLHAAFLLAAGRVLLSRKAALRTGRTALGMTIPYAFLWVFDELMWVYSGRDTGLWTGIVPMIDASRLITGELYSWLGSVMLAMFLMAYLGGNLALLLRLVFAKPYSRAETDSLRLQAGLAGLGFLLLAMIEYPFPPRCVLSLLLAVIFFIPAAELFRCPECRAFSLYAFEHRREDFHCPKCGANAGAAGENESSVNHT